MWLFSKDPSSSFGYDIGGIVENLPDQNWTLNYCISKKKQDAGTNNEYSALVYDCTGVSPSSHELIQAQSSVKRLKSLRHPDILAYIDGLETPKAITVVTEKVQPLESYLNSKSDSGNFTFMTSWGIYQVSRALAFLNRDCNLTHCNVRMNSIFVTRSGEWKLGALSRVTPTNEIAQTTFATGNIYWPTDKQKVDSFGLGCLIWEVFNKRLQDANQLRHAKLIPAQLQPAYSSLIHSKATQRCTVPEFMGKCTKKGGFSDNFYVETLLFLEEIQIKEKDEKNEFLASLADKVENFPDDIAKYKILPHLLHCFQYGGSGVEVLVPLLKLSKLLEQSEFENTVLPCLVKLFTSSDRATRVKLLEYLPEFVEHLPGTVVNDQIFQPVCQGFIDSNPLVREATIRSMVHMASKLNDKNLNDVLARHLTHLQVKDDQGGIRTNATVCLAKISSGMKSATRQGPILNAFLKCTRDPFPPARQAAVTALSSSLTFYTMQDIAGKLLPCLSFLTVDAVKDVRDIAFKAIRSAVSRLEQASNDPDSVVVETGAGTAANISASQVSWTNWAVSALSKLSVNKNKDTPSPKLSKANATGDSNKPLSGSPTASDNESHKPPQHHSDKKETKKRGEGGGGALKLGEKIGTQSSKEKNMDEIFGSFGLQQDDDPFSDPPRKNSSGGFVNDNRHKPTSSYNWNTAHIPQKEKEEADDDDGGWDSFETFDNKASVCDFNSPEQSDNKVKAVLNDWNTDSFFTNIAESVPKSSGNAMKLSTKSQKQPATQSSSSTNRPLSVNKEDSLLPANKTTSNSAAVNKSKKKPAARKSDGWDNWGDANQSEEEGNAPGDWGNW